MSNTEQGSESGEKVPLDEITYGYLAQNRTTVHLSPDCHHIEDLILETGIHAEKRRVRLDHPEIEQMEICNTCKSRYVDTENERGVTNERH